MVVMLSALRRRSDLSREAFLTYWREAHAPLVRALAEPLGLKRYVQLHSESVSEEGWDGVAEVWFDSRDDLKARLRTDAGRAAAGRVHADEVKFLDLARICTWWGANHVIF